MLFRATAATATTGEDATGAVVQEKAGACSSRISYFFYKCVQICELINEMVAVGFCKTRVTAIIQKDDFEVFICFRTNMSAIRSAMYAASIG